MVSDVHLGCKHSQASEFLAFLQRFSPEAVYLVGDFIDAWKFNTAWHWSAECNEVIAHLMSWSRQGTQLFYVPGNHDAFLRNPLFRSGLMSENQGLRIANEFVFVTSQGWRFLVTHGDLFDCVESNAQWASKGSSAFYDGCLSLNRRLHRWRCSKRGESEHPTNPYGVCALLKDRVKRCIKFVSNYESKIMAHARTSHCDGVICGHIHTPDIIASDSMWYCNTGDWVENCTGLVERHDGQIRLVQRYAEDRVLDLPKKSMSQKSDCQLPIEPQPLTVAVRKRLSEECAA
ncbi:UDP-2,3-diacylglucosamine hydrolase [Novipirellula aureliae]|uniref:UDP-2,3-diacylglucosamine hydrolase n=2 Tax=Novipirellula aureliae TaxID=2527966 RepID=A0A5C6E6C3_9BACT|nr:UDP-2,3-diacylglucosamine hydrolase [Novipirellula aureliae]